MMGVIDLGSGRVKVDVCTLSSRGRHRGWIEDQVYATSTVEAMGNIDSQRHEVWSNWEES